MANAQAVQEDTTAKIIALLNQVDPNDWSLPWHCPGNVFGTNGAFTPQNPLSGTRYSGANWIILALTSGAFGPYNGGDTYPSGRYATYRQWKKAGYQVRRGESGTPVIFYKEVERQKPAPPGKDEVYRMLRTFTVFAAEQVDGTELPVEDHVIEGSPHERAEAFILATGAETRWGGKAACCRHSIGDAGISSAIEMPMRENFTTYQRFYSTWLHELVHWTKYPTGRSSWLEANFKELDERYAFEELVAELGAAMLSAHLQVANDPLPENAQYVSAWLSRLNDDSTYIFKAAARAQAAISHLIKLVDAAPAAERSVA
ncbi:MAG: zincin-like metallopeptidase domain-containing protein [Planctomycetota bacterium]|jgi:antirestriction protein ArdC|nr:zincin-like metallopeptidase domain-containing protein [Planctomycetota bacterium]